MAKISTQVSAKLDEKLFYEASKVAEELHVSMADLVRLSIKAYIGMRNAYKAQKAKNLLNNVSSGDKI